MYFRFYIVMLTLVSSCHLSAAVLPASLAENIYNTESFSNGKFQFKAIVHQLLSESYFWKNYSSVLLLGEGSTNWQDRDFQIPLAEALHLVYPQMLVTRTDIDTPYKEQGTFITGKANHTHKFSKHGDLRAGSYDLVLMKRGLCHCRAFEGVSVTCGGLDTRDNQLLKKFLVQVISLVNWNGLKPLIHLEGEHFPHDSWDKESAAQFKKRRDSYHQALASWKRNLVQVLDKFSEIPLDGEVLLNHHGHFTGILIWKQQD